MYTKYKVAPFCLVTSITTNSPDNATINVKKSGWQLSCIPFCSTELLKEDTEEYRNRELLAERQALEIEGNPTYHENVDLENGDEEMIYSAVHRGSDETPVAPMPGNGAIATAKYVAPHLRQGSGSPAQRPQQLVVMPSQSETPRTHVQPTTTLPPVAPGAGNNVAAQGGPAMIRLNGRYCPQTDFVFF